MKVTVEIMVCEGEWDKGFTKHNMRFDVETSQSGPVAVGKLVGVLVDAVTEAAQDYERVP